MLGFFEKKEKPVAIVPVLDFGDDSKYLLKARMYLESPELRNFLRQRIAIAAGQIAVYQKSDKGDKVVPMLAGKIEELSYLVDAAPTEIAQIINERSGKKEEAEIVDNIPFVGAFSNIINHDVSDGG